MAVHQKEQEMVADFVTSCLGGPQEALDFGRIEEVFRPFVTVCHRER